MISHALDHYIGCLVSILYNCLPVIFDPEISNSTSLVSWKWSSEVTLWQLRIGAWKGVVSLWISVTGADSVDLFSVSGDLSWIVTEMHQIGTFKEYVPLDVENVNNTEVHWASNLTFTTYNVDRLSF